MDVNKKRQDINAIINLFKLPVSYARHNSSIDNYASECTWDQIVENGIKHYKPY
jgi:hypothetical protein